MQPVKQQPVTIKARRSRGGLIEWNYDSPQQAARVWHKLIETGLTPDTGERLESASYFRAGTIKPTREWNRRDLEKLNQLCRMFGM